jgi:hypothetical protein
MKKLMLLFLFTGLTFTIYSQHQLLEKALQADTTETITDIKDLNLQSNAWHHFLLNQGGQTEKDWQEYNHFSKTSEVFDYDTFYIDIKYNYLSVEETSNDKYWAYVLKDQRKIFSTTIDYYISKGGNIVAKKKTFKDGVIFWSWWTNNEIIDRIGHHKFF